MWIGVPVGESLQAFAACAYSVRVASFGRVKDLDTALDIARHVLPAYERLLGVPYPLPKLDLVAIPDFAAGAMENWGLLLYRETALLAADNSSSIHTLRGVAATIAHEMAHLVRINALHVNARLVVRTCREHIDGPVERSFRAVRHVHWLLHGGIEPIHHRKSVCIFSLCRGVEIAAQSGLCTFHVAGRFLMHFGALLCHAPIKESICSMRH